MIDHATIGQRVVAAVGMAGARELLDALTRTEADRAALIGRLAMRDDAAWLADVLTDLGGGRGSPPAFDRGVAQGGGVVRDVSPPGDSIEAMAQEPRLRQLGRPAIVACDVDLGSGADFRTHPPLWSAFTRQRRGDEDYGSTVHYRASVPVVAVWRPGDGEYDQFHGLPADEGAPPRG